MGWYKSFDKEGMVDDLKERWPLGGIWSKNLRDEVLHLFGKIAVGREFIVVFADAPTDSKIPVRCVAHDSRALTH